MRVEDAREVNWAQRSTGQCTEGSSEVSQTSSGCSVEDIRRRLPWKAGSGTAARVQTVGGDSLHWDSGSMVQTRKRWRRHLGGGDNRTAQQGTWYQVPTQRMRMMAGGRTKENFPVKEEENQKHGGKREEVGDV